MSVKNKETKIMDLEKLREEICILAFTLFYCFHHFIFIDFICFFII